MTKDTEPEQATSLEHHILNVIKSYISDKDSIEWRKRASNDPWQSASSSRWDFQNYEYRIKPKEPRVRYCVEAPSGKIMTPSFNTLHEAVEHQITFGASVIVKFIEVME